MSLPHTSTKFLTVSTSAPKSQLQTGVWQKQALGVVATYFLFNQEGPSETDYNKDHTVVKSVQTCLSKLHCTF